jgi:hypothetical protein
MIKYLGPEVQRARRDQDDYDQSLRTLILINMGRRRLRMTLRSRDRKLCARHKHRA